MGDYRTVAAVSRAIAHVLEGALDRRGMRGEYKVTIASPHQTSTDRNHNKSINIFLYHVRPTPSLRNNDLPVFEAGRMVNTPTIGLDLYYLLSFYGNKPNDLESERLLGIAVTALNAHPLLTQTDFHASADPEKGALGVLDTVAVTPMTLTIEEMQRIWTMFPSVPYVLSMSYVASAALLVGDEIPAPPAPVSAVAPKASAKLAPQITALGRADGKNTPVTFQSTLRIAGQRLASTRVVVDIAGVRLPAPAGSVTDTSIDVALTDPRLRAGTQAVSVIQLEVAPGSSGAASSDTDSAPTIATSNRLDLALTPLLLSASAVDVHQEGTSHPPKYRGKLDLSVEPMPKSGQRAGVILQRSGQDSYAFAAELEHGKLIADFLGVAGGKYLIRYEVDGVSTLLEPQGGQPYTSPTVLIAPRRPKNG